MSHIIIVVESLGGVQIGQGRLPVALAMGLRVKDTVSFRFIEHGSTDFVIERRSIRAGVDVETSILILGVVPL